MAVSVEDVQKVLYLDGDADDDLLKGYLTAADQFVRNAIGSNEDFYERKDVVPLFDGAVKALAATYYQYRLSASDTQVFPINMTVNSIIGQLRGKYELEVGDDSETSNKPTQSSN